MSPSTGDSAIPVDRVVEMVEDPEQAEVVSDRLKWLQETVDELWADGFSEEANQKNWVKDSDSEFLYLNLPPSVWDRLVASTINRTGNSFDDDLKRTIQTLHGDFFDENADFDRIAWVEVGSDQESDPVSYEAFVFRRPE